MISAVKKAHLQPARMIYSAFGRTRNISLSTMSCMRQVKTLHTGHYRVLSSKHYRPKGNCDMSTQTQGRGSESRKFSHTKYPYRTVAVAGAVIAAGIFIKLKSATVDQDKKDEATEDTVKVAGDSLSLSEAIKQSRDLLQRIKDETGSPGLIVAVSVNGRNVWAEGMGYADVENRLPCTPQTIFRIASISKSITMTAVAKLCENGDLDLDKPVQFYVKEFPEKSWEGEKVNITTRQLLSHMSGIRHYDKSYMKPKPETAQGEKQTQSPSQSDTKGQNSGSRGKQSDNKSQKLDHKEQKSSSTDKQSEKGKNSGSIDKQSDDKGQNAGITDKQSNKSQNANPSITNRDVQAGRDEMLQEEYYIMQKYSSVMEGLNLFKDDPLVHKPGTKFLYTTHGWTLVSAVVEKAAKMPFEQLLKKMLDEMGLENTYMEEHQTLIYNRGRHYVKNNKGRLVNAPYVDLSYKWAGGGLISNVFDLTKFGNIMLYSYQARGYHSGNSRSVNGRQPQSDQRLNNSQTKAGKENSERGYLKPETVSEMWSIVSRPKSDWEGIADGGYGLGWSVWVAKKEHAFCKDQKFIVSHTGGAIGASSVLFILPLEELGVEVKGPVERTEKADCSLPQGVVVAIIVNMMSVGLNKAAFEIAKIFQKVDLNQKTEKYIKV